MKKNLNKILLVTLFLFGLFNFLEAKDLKMLNKQDESIIKVSILTTTGDTEKLAKSLNEALDNKLTINEVKEILVQTYAYAGFPRSLGGIFTFMKVLEDRKAAGIKDEVGREASAVPTDLNKDEYGAKVRAKLAGQDTIPPDSGYQLFSPIIDTFLKEHLFADIFVRDLLTHKQRELSTISVLAALGNVKGPIAFHFKASMNTGWTKDELNEFIEVVRETIGDEKADEAKSVLETL